jgi:hypothetical protein
MLSSDSSLNFQENLFYIVPTGAMLAYRESVESIFEYHKVKRTFMHTSQDLDHSFFLLVFFFSYGSCFKMLNHKVDRQLCV